MSLTGTECRDADFFNSISVRYKSRAAGGSRGDYNRRNSRLDRIAASGFSKVKTQMVLADAVCATLSLIENKFPQNKCMRRCGDSFYPPG